MHAVGHENAVQYRLDRLRDQRLQRHALQGKVESRHSGEHAAPSGHRGAQALAANDSAGSLDAPDAPTFHAKPGNLAVLDDVDTQGAGRPGESPRDGIMSRGSGARLEQGSHHRLGAIEIDEGNPCLDLVRSEKLRINAMHAVSIATAPDLVHLVLAVRKEHQSALGKHEVEVELLRQPFPQAHRVLVDRTGLVPEIVGPDDGRVASRVAAADVSLLEHCNISDPVLPGEVVGSRKTVPAAANHDHVVTGPWFAIMENGLPSPVRR